MDSPFLESIAQGLAAAGIRVVRFEFPYMAARRRGGRRPPDRAPVLLATWREVIAQVGEPRHLAIGGKSLGGRMASMIADELGVRALVCLGYPFHPPGEPTRLRTAHLRELRTPALVVQGERDAFGSRAEVAGYALSPAIRFLWIPDGDHSFAPRVRTGDREALNLQAAIAGVRDFLVAAAHPSHGSPTREDESPGAGHELHGHG